MKLGAYTACLHDRSLDETLKLLRNFGLTGAEINSGGFLPPVHIPMDRLRESQAVRDDYLGQFDAAGVTLTALNVNGNPLHPDPEVGPRHADDLRASIEVASLLGVKRVVTMSGLPAARPGGTAPAWTVVPWESASLDTLDYQWNEVVLPFWNDIAERAKAARVKVCIEMHPHNVVFNPATLKRLVALTGATHVGAEMDPSHLFWQGIDPIAAVEHLAGLVFHAAAKDTRINEENCQVNGVLDDRHQRVPPEDGPVSLGGRYTLNRWPDSPSWEFVAVGRGHDQAYWSRFLQALHSVDTDMAVNIEHEDEEFDQVEGLRLAAENLTAAASAVGL